MTSPFRGSPFLSYNNKRGGLSPNSVNINKKTTSPISLKSFYNSKKTKEPFSPITIASSDNEDEFESPEKKREIAEKLLIKSDLRQKKKVKEKLETHIDKDIRLMKDKSEKQSDDRLKALNNQEQEHVEYVKRMFGDLEKVYYERSQRKVRLLNQLFYLKAKQMMNKIAFESNIEENIISTDEITEIANLKTRAWMANIVEENIQSLKGDFIYKFEAFTRITPEQEIQELKESIFKYVSPVAEKKKRDSSIARKNHYQSIKACKERVLNAFTRNIKNKFEKNFEDKYQEKVHQIGLGKEAVQLSPDEIIEFLEADVEDYETDIGVIDAEIDRINNEINEWREKIEMKREYHEKQKAAIQSQIDYVSQSNTNLLSSIQKLKKQQQAVKLADTKFVESVGGTLLSELIDKTHRILKHDVPRLKHQSAATEEEIMGLQKTIIENENEFSMLTDKMKSDEESMNTISKRLSILGVRLYQHEKNIKVLEENKIRAQNECEKLRAKLVALRKEAPKRQLKAMASDYALKEMIKSSDINRNIFATDLTKHRENNEMIMEFLKERRTRLQELFEYNQQKLRKLIKYSGSLECICSPTTNLEHSIATIYQEELDKAVEKYRNTIESLAVEAVNKTNISSKFKERAKEGSIIYKFSNNLFENDLMRYEMGVDNQGIDKAKVNDLIERQFTKEGRLILLLNFLLEITGLNQEYILPDGFSASHSSLLDLVRNKNFLDHSGTSIVVEPTKSKNDNSFLDNKIYGEINTIFINAIEKQTVADKHDVMGRIDQLQELICKKEGVNMDELEQKLQKKLVLVQREKERTASLQKELERIERKNLETSNTTEREVRIRVNSLPLPSTDTVVYFDEETNKIVAEERQTRKRNSSFSPIDLIEKIETAKSNNQNQN